MAWLRLHSQLEAELELDPSVQIVVTLSFLTAGWALVPLL